ncbi:hypothetical protein FA95DRAFT_928202 [Auriscalpium vulgare]|uniref:Uncharacterized protein n=1 Tax=Auriscalpium vulgare TaxID=40419 RepID=A0ACB8R8Z6_9AGAM|nr:hypothetical protein FA95DRAFT_928202 [Auriscalpium vulgare]
MAAVPSFNRGGTIGVEYFGVIFSTILYGVTCIQTFHYFRSVKAGSDVWWIRAMVITLFVLDTTHEAFLIHVPYHYLITHYGDPEALLKNIWTIPFSIVISSSVAFVTNSFFVYRIWKLSSSKVVSAFCFVGAVAELAGSLVYNARLYLNEDMVKAEVSLKATGLIAISIAAASNVVISATMIFYLHGSRTGVRRSDSVITKLIVLVVSTGTATTVFLFADLISYFIAPDLLYVLMFEFMIGKLYVNSVLTCLNMRDYVNNTLSDKSANAVHLPRIDHGSSQGSSAPKSECQQILNLSPSMQANPGDSGVKFESYSFNSSLV